MSAAGQTVVEEIEPGRQIAVVRGGPEAYDQLVRVFHAILDHHNVLLGHHGRGRGGDKTFDELMGFPEGYATKQLGPSHTRVMGKSLGTWLTGLRCKLIVAEDELATCTVLAKTKKRTRANSAMPTQRSKKRRHFSAFRDRPGFAKQARAEVVLRQTAQQRRRIAKHAAKARWAKRRAGTLP